ncbi:type IV pilus inner membrane component PilO [Endothiovibrio diazotrophicus]
MDLSDLNNLDLADLNIDPNNPGGWPLWAKIGAGVLLAAVIVGGAYYFDTMDQQEALAGLEKKEDELRTDFEVKQRKAANLEKLRAQLKEMEESFGSMLRQLPEKTEVENLLDDISHTGLASGLEFTLFKPAGEVRKEFYAELPISLNVNGNYHEFGAFASGVAALPRIVTLHNINISGKGSELNMSATAKTYRYLEE